MSEWIEYTGSDEQITEIEQAYSKHGFMFTDTNGRLSGVIHGDKPLPYKFVKEHEGIWGINKYLICQRHTCAKLIKIWADTGCPVWVKRPIAVLRIGEPIVFKTTNPDWNIPGAEYRLTPFED